MLVPRAPCIPVNFCPFPPVSQADDGGLLMLGGRLTPDWLLAAYSRGIFPWPITVSDNLAVLAWFSPDPRAILPLDALHVPQRLERRLRRHEFQFTWDQAFERVISACAGPRRDQTGTWITPEMMQAYCRLSQLGHAHSLEVWQQGELVGGLYGVALGGYFSAESMFHRVYDASKAAVVQLARELREAGFSLLDTQQATPHLSQLGGREIPRREFLKRLKQALAAEGWSQEGP